VALSLAVAAAATRHMKNERVAQTTREGFRPCVTDHSSLSSSSS
jgi:hypothetical protein